MKLCHGLAILAAGYKLSVKLKVMALKHSHQVRKIHIN